MKWNRTRTAVTVLTLATTLLPVASVGPADASFPGDNGGFIFEGFLGANEAIATLGPHAGNMQPLVRTPNESVELGKPTWSPSGDWVAYVNPPGGVVVMRADGTHSKIVYRARRGPAYSVSWSPRGRRLVFARRGGISTMRRDGSHVTRLTRTPRAWADEPVWSSRGLIAFEAGGPGGNPHIWVMRADGSHQTQLTFGRNADMAPNWAPGGHRLVYEHDWTLATVWADGTHQVSMNIPAISPVWSPDGSRIAYISDWTMGDGDGDIHTVAPDGTSHRRLGCPRGVTLFSIDWRPR